MLKNRSIRAKLALVTAVPLLASLLFGVLAFRTLSAVKIKGSSYNEIIESKDLVADVLPPPEYLIEAFLVAHQSVDAYQASDRQAFIERLAELEKDYRDRHEYWKATFAPDRGQQSVLSDIEHTLIEESYTPADEFFKTVDADLVPALQVGDLGSVHAVVSIKLTPLYEQHRVAIDKVVALANRRSVEVEQAADGLVKRDTLVLAVGLGVASLLSLVLGSIVVRSIRRSVLRLRKAAQEDLPRAIAELRNADEDELDSHRMTPVDLGTNDELGEAATAFNDVLQTAVGLAGEQAQLRRRTSEMFVNLGRRNQNLVSRQLRFIDSLEGTEQDPDRLAELFRLDNLATRMRRNAESLLVLAGVEPPRRWRKPVAIRDVMRSAAAEIEDFARVELTQVEPVHIQGASVANLAHLLAELVENAARFSPPDSKVTVTGVRVGNEYLIGVQDRGMGMAADAVEVANERLRTAVRLDEVPTAYLGHFVVARLAQREDVHVEIESPPGEGVTVWVRLPGAVISDEGPAPAREPTSVPQAAPSRATVPSRAGVAPAPVPSASPARVPTAPAADPAPMAPQVPPTVAPALVGLVPGGSRLLPPPPAHAVPTVAPEPAAMVTRSGFVKRSAKKSTVAFDRFAVDDEPVVAPESPGARQRRLDQFTAGKRAAASQVQEFDGASPRGPYEKEMNR